MPPASTAATPPLDEPELEGSGHGPAADTEAWAHRRRPTDPHAHAPAAGAPPSEAAAAAPSLPGWLVGLQETLQALPEDRREVVGRHVMQYAQRLVEAEATDDRSLQALTEGVRGVILHLGEHRGDELRKAWHVVLAYLAEIGQQPDEPELRRFLDVAYTLAADGGPSGERVATLPPGARRRVWLTALGRDDDGDVWVDPLAATRLVGADEAHPWVERDEDGRVTVDLSGLADDATVGPQDPAKHRMRAAVRDGG